MGIKTTQGGAGAVFYKINAKTGQFTTGSGANKQYFEAGRTSLEGLLIGAKVEEDEYEGVKNESIRLIFRDTEPGQPNIHVTMGISNGGTPSAFAIKALAKINAAEFDQPLSLTPFLITAGTKLGEQTYAKDVSGVSVKQGGQKLVEDLGTPDNKLPECPTVMVNGKPLVMNGKEVKDRSAWSAVLDSQLDKLFSRLTPAETPAVEGEEGVSVDDVAAGAAAARDAMRARA